MRNDGHPEVADVAAKPLYAEAKVRKLPVARLLQLVTEGGSVSEALADAEDALAAVVEICEDCGRPLPPSVYLDDVDGPVAVEAFVAIPCDTGTQLAN